MSAATRDDLASEFRDELLASGLLVAGSELGLYLRSFAFEQICAGIDQVISREVDEAVTARYYCPVIVGKDLLVKTDYVRSFPQLLGSISGFDEGKSNHRDMLAAVESGENWTDLMNPTGLALCSAGCHSLYPMLEQVQLEEPAVYEIVAHCFRHEPSSDPVRMQVFRMHEIVYLGDPDGALEHREKWIKRGLAIHDRLGLAVTAEIANDPFFGRAGALLAATQRSDALKVELVCSMYAVGEPTAISSANYHLDHFGLAFDIQTDEEQVAHSACFGFGIERVALALLRTHGLDIKEWPESVRFELGLR